MYEVLLQTPRLYVRRLCEADLDAFQHYRTNHELARYQGWSVTDDEAALGGYVQPRRRKLVASWVGLQAAGASGFPVGHDN